MLNLEELQKQFINAHCAWALFCNIEDEIGRIITSKLPKHIQKKICSIGFNTDFKDYMILEVRIVSANIDEVYASLTTVYPSMKWSIHDMGHFSCINLKLNDDVIASLPLYLYEHNI